MHGTLSRARADNRRAARREYDRDGSGAYLCDDTSKSSSPANERSDVT